MHFRYCRHRLPGRGRPQQEERKKYRRGARGNRREARPGQAARSGIVQSGQNPGAERRVGIDIHHLAHRTVDRVVEMLFTHVCNPLRRAFS